MMYIQILYDKKILYESVYIYLTKWTIKCMREEETAKLWSCFQSMKKKMLTNFSLKWMQTTNFEPCLLLVYESLHFFHIPPRLTFRRTPFAIITIWGFNVKYTAGNSQIWWFWQNQFVGPFPDRTMEKNQWRLQPAHFQNSYKIHRSRL